MIVNALAPCSDQTVTIKLPYVGILILLRSGIQAKQNFLVA